jgi:hypothetical protein
MFGAVNALFTGLALAGVALTLYSQAEQQRRQAKPFLIPRLDPEVDGWVTIMRPVKRGGVIELPIEIAVPLNNPSNEAALNVRVTVGIESCRVEATATALVPVASGASQVVTVKAAVSGESADSLVGDLASNKAVIAQLRVSYTSLDGVAWQSAVNYNLCLGELRASGDAALLRAAIDDSGQTEGANPWAGSTKVQLQASPVDGSWRYQEV